MSATSLKSLTIGHLRGSVQRFELQFEASKKLTVIYGENAAGKTTICDAFEFLGKGMVGSLEERGLGRTSRYWHSVGRAPADVFVTLDTADGACTARIHRGEIVAVPVDARPKVEVLRRNRIASLVEARPAGRYEEIRRFIDVSAVESGEAALRDLIRGLNSTRETAVARVQENEEAVRGFWASAGSPVEDPVSWATRESARDVTTLQNEAKALNDLRGAYQRVAGSSDKLRSATDAIGAAAIAKANATKLRADMLAEVAEGAGDVVEVLEAAQSYLDRHPQPLQCPVCESSERVERLRERVLERTTQFANLQKANRTDLAAARAVDVAKGKLEDVLVECKRDAQAFRKVRDGYPWGKDVPLPPECPEEPLPGVKLFSPSATITLPHRVNDRSPGRVNGSEWIPSLLCCSDLLLVGSPEGDQRDANRAAAPPFPLETASEDAPGRAIATSARAWDLPDPAILDRGGFMREWPRSCCWRRRKSGCAFQPRRLDSCVP